MSQMKAFMFAWDALLQWTLYSGLQNTVDSTIPPPTLKWAEGSIFKCISYVMRVNFHIVLYLQ